MARATRSAWWSRSRGLPDDAYASWVTSMREVVGRTPRILAWAGEGDRLAIGSPTVLSTGGTSGWQHVGWHEIERGGWNDELRRLSWVRLDGRRGEVQLAEPGRLPELFRERVEATIVVRQFVPLAGERGVTISARRPLGASAPLVWHTSLTRGLTWQTAGVREAVDDALAATRAEFDMR
ncbi:hypothetical protein GCM10009616_20990 [Microlunatus lacustris]